MAFFLVTSSFPILFYKGMNFFELIDLTDFEAVNPIVLKSKHRNSYFLGAKNKEDLYTSDENESREEINIC